jgi:enoyl-CoA hydratase/carnithine racemase
MTEPLLLVERDGDVATVTFHDPDRLNAMTEPMGRAIAERMAELADDDALRAVVVTGAGRAFSAGGDLDMIERMAREGAADPGGPTRDRNREFMRRFYGLYLAVRTLPQPTVAAIHGHAIGAGFCVALACDVRIAAREAKLGLNFTRLGIHPGMGATWLLPRLVGPAHAAEILYTGRLLEGPEAERIGLVNRALPAAEVRPAALELARTIAACAPIAVRGTKRSLRESEDATLEAQLEREATEQALCYESGDLLEGLAAARERRAARFSGA